jgi:fucose permease
MILLVIIYLAFISLGLPDGMLGAVWPAMRITFEQPLESAGTIVIISTLCSAVSSFLSGRIIRRLGTGPLVLASCLATGLAILGCSLVPSFAWVLLLSIPLGFGAGSVDSALNQYVAHHYSSRHMNWLHCSWGIGATGGPMILAWIFSVSLTWRTGYRIVSYVQLSLALIFLLTLGLWGKEGEKYENHTEEENLADSANRIDTLKALAPWLSVGFFSLYVAAEFGIGLWTGSLLADSRGFSKETAGLFVAFYYGSITVGRFFAGFISDRLGNRVMVRGGILISLAGALLLSIPVSPVLALIGLILLGLGFAPQYPAMIHETPRRFGKETARLVIGFQLGASYMCGALFPAGLGLLASKTTLEIIGPVVAGIIVLLLIVSEKLNLLTPRKKSG